MPTTGGSGHARQTLIWRLGPCLLEATSDYCCKFRACHFARGGGGGWVLPSCTYRRIPDINEKLAFPVQKSHVSLSCRRFACTERTFNYCTSRPDVCQCLVVQTPMDITSENKPSTSTTHVHVYGMQSIPGHFNGTSIPPPSSLLSRPQRVATGVLLCAQLHVQLISAFELQLQARCASSGLLFKWRPVARTSPLPQPFCRTSQRRSKFSRTVEIMGRHCRKCGTSHEKPTGRGCSRVAVTDGTTSDQAEQNGDMMAILRDIQSNMSSVEKRLCELEKADNNTTAGRNIEPQDTQAVTEPQECQQPQPMDREQVNAATPQSLRANQDAMAQVAVRLAEWGLTEDSTNDQTGDNPRWRARAKKSGTVSKGTDTVKDIIDWPHFHIRKGSMRTTPEYADITSEEFVLGFIRMLQDPESKYDRDRMLEILRDLMEDAVDFGWGRARAFYGMIGLDVEQRQLSWTDEQTILKMRLTHFRAETSGPYKKGQRQGNVVKNKVCAAFQTKSCDQIGDHGAFRHICDFCLRTKNQPFPHPEDECRSKMHTQPKNV